MSARAGMTELIARLRAMTASGTADYSVGTVIYWVDDQLQDILDQNRRDFRREPLQPEPTYDAGNVRYYDYYFARRNLEGTASGTAAWRIEDGAGNTIAGALYTPNLNAQHLLFSYNTLGSAYYLSGREYDLERAAAQVWEQKAADVADRFDLKVDNHDMKRSQLHAHYLKMAAQMRSKAKVTFTRLKRIDAY